MWIWVVVFLAGIEPGTYGWLDFLSAALSTTELRWRMLHRKSFSTLLQKNELNKLWCFHNFKLKVGCMLLSKAWQLGCVVMCYRLLHCFAMCCSALKKEHMTWCKYIRFWQNFSCNLAHLQHIAMHCNYRTLQVNTIHYNANASRLPEHASWARRKIHKHIRDDVKLAAAQLVRARDCQSRGRRFDSGKISQNRELKSTWIWGT